MNLELQLLRSIALVQAQAQSRRALAEPRKKFRRYKVRFAILALEKAHENLSQVVEEQDRDNEVDTRNQAPVNPLLDFS